MDIFFEKVKAGDFLKFIALCIATFAFLHTYLSFPKNFLEKIWLLKNKPLNGSKESEKLKRVEAKLVDYYILLDLITAWLLVFLVFSIICSCGFLMVEFQLVWYESPHTGLRCYLFSVSLIYTILMCGILGWVCRLRRNQWKENGNTWLRWVTCCRVITYVTGVFLMLSSAICGFGWFFVIMLFKLVILFILFIYILGKYNPLAELASVWGLLNRNEKSKTRASD